MKQLRASAGSVAIVCAMLLALASPALAAPFSVAASDPQTSLLSQSADLVSKDLLPDRAVVLLTMGKGISSTEAAGLKEEADKGTVVVAFDSTEEALLSAVGVGGGGWYESRPDQVKIAWFAWQPGGYYAAGSRLVDSPATAKGLSAELTAILETVRDDPDRHSASHAQLAQLALSPEGGVPAGATSSSWWRSIATKYPPGYSGSVYKSVSPYGKLGRGLDVDELWDDGSSTTDYWRGHSLDEVVPGKYVYGSDWRSEQYRVKWIANYSYEDIVEKAPGTTAQSWSYTFGYPGSFSVGQTISDMEIEWLGALYGSPNYVYWYYNWTNDNAPVAMTPYNEFEYWWKQNQTQNVAFDATGYNTYRVIDPSIWGDDHYEIVGGAWGVNVHKPGY